MGRPGASGEPDHTPWRYGIVWSWPHGRSRLGRHRSRIFQSWRNNFAPSTGLRVFVELIANATVAVASSCAVASAQTQMHDDSGETLHKFNVDHKSDSFTYRGFRFLHERNFMLEGG
jgi:hypothetical protein